MGLQGILQPPWAVHRRRKPSQLACLCYCCPPAAPTACSDLPLLFGPVRICCQLCRVATTGLLALLCTTYPDYHIVFIALIALDIFSHWFQMYQTLLAGSSTHKVGAVGPPAQAVTRQWLGREALGESMRGGL